MTLLNNQRDFIPLQYDEVSSQFCLDESVISSRVLDFMSIYVSKLEPFISGAAF